MTERGCAIIFCRVLVPPSPDATIFNYLNDREEWRYYFCRILAPPSPTQQYFTILTTDRGVVIIFCRILALAPQCPPPPQTPQYLRTESMGRDALSFVGCWCPSPPSLFLRRQNPNYLDDRERGRQ